MRPQDFATDPEVAEDLIRRSRSERDQGRTREPRNPFGSAAVVESWPCRGRCGAMVGATQEAIDALEAGNALLRKRREAPIQKHQCLWCPKCKARDDELRQMEIAAAAKPRQREMPLGEAERLAALTSGKRRRTSL